MLGVTDAEAREELLDRLRCALRWLQSLEPTGVGARGLEECLILQLRTLPAQPRARRLAIASARTTSTCWPGATCKRLTALTGADEDQVRAAQA
jgi:RNA polymerase sigma-54 factor